MNERPRIRWICAAIILAAAGLMSYAGKSRLHLDMDITKSLPVNDPVVADAEYVMTRHPVKDRIVIDLGTDAGEDALIRGAEMVEDMLVSSGLFKSVGLDEYQSLFPELIGHIMGNLPVLFSARDLETRVRPMLAPEKIRKALEDDYASLMDLEGIGQSGMIAADPPGNEEHRARPHGAPRALDRCEDRARSPALGRRPPRACHR